MEERLKKELEKLLKKYGLTDAPYFLKNESVVSRYNDKYRTVEVDTCIKIFDNETDELVEMIGTEEELPFKRPRLIDPSSIWLNDR